MINGVVVPGLKGTALTGMIESYQTGTAREEFRVGAAGRKFCLVSFGRRIESVIISATQEAKQKRMVWNLVHLVV